MSYKFDYIGKVPTSGSGKPTAAKRAELRQLLNPIIEWMHAEWARVDYTSRKIRSWCYTFEMAGYITKDDFKNFSNQLTNWRKWGFIPLEMASEDDDRSVRNSSLELFDDEHDIDAVIKAGITRMLSAGAPYVHPFAAWENQDRVIVVGCEKSDVAELLMRGVPDYIPWFATGGQPDMHTRAQILKLFNDVIEAGKDPVLLYIGDHDPHGFKISGGMMGDTLVGGIRNNKFEEIGLVENLREVEEAADCVGVVDEIEFIRLGIDLDWCQDNGITPVNNLITGNGKDLAKGKLDYVVEHYIRQFGTVKAECNALFAVPEAAQQWFSSIVWSNMDVDAHNAYVANNEAAQTAVIKAWAEVMAKIKPAISAAIQ